MASLVSHPATAFALYPFVRRYGLGARALLVGALCCEAPDLDAVGFNFGIPYGSLLGHRGLTHSLLAAALLAACLVRLAAGASSTSRALGSAGLYLFTCTASHGVLDALTSGGLGVAFFSPFNTQRYFFPWRPILVSPIGITPFFSARGIEVLASELVTIWLPCAVLAGIGWAVARRPPDDDSATLPLQSGVLTSPADAMLRRAIARTLEAPIAERADLFEHLAGEIEAFMAARPEERPWTCVRYTATDGSRVFRGGIGHSLVIDSAGRLWRARSYEDFETTYTLTATTCTIASLTPIYAQMRAR